MRLDKFIFEKGLAESRQKAQTLISSGGCLVNSKTVTKCSVDVSELDSVEIIGQAPKYVGRGGLKLEGALEAFKISVKDLVCVDIGASTGGFTDCLLQYGASKVYAIDCGHGQLHERLQNNFRVVNLEGFNARQLTPENIGGLADMAVMDVSFISQKTLHNTVSGVLKEGGYFISLIKPQFEVGRENIGKGGIVKNKALYGEVIKSVCESAAESSLTLQSYIESPIKGGDGNTEFIALFIKKCAGE